MTERRERQIQPRRVNLWRIAIIVILLLALATRLYGLGDRAVSHDETTHAKYSWNLYMGHGFAHDPLMHGPLLFEATALAYALFGVSDFTARLYTALAGVALVMTPWLLRRWLGRLGALAASLMLLISPSIAYYSRYTRHDIPLLLFSTLLLWSIARYIEGGESRWLRWMGAFFALMFATKENAYIYTAIFMVLLVLPLAWQVLHLRWQRRHLLPLLVALILFVAAAGGVVVVAFRQGEVAMAESAHLPETVLPGWGRVALGMVVLGLLAVVVLVTYAAGEAQVRRLRLFDVLMVLGTLTLPLGSSLLMQFVAGVSMTSFYPAMMAINFADVSFSATVGAGVMLLLSLGAGIALGLWWDIKRWPWIALVHYAVFIVLYSTLFTYGWGVVTGLVGGLAYWIAQQHVERGEQPWYYYGIVGPLYEYAAIVISLAGMSVLAATGLSRLLGSKRAPDEGTPPVPPRRVPATLTVAQLTPLFLFGWAVLSWVAYAIAGEKMPWLFVHIALPHILLAAWTLQRWFGHLGWRDLIEAQAWLVPVSLVFLFLAWAAFQASSGTVRQLLQQSGTGGGLSATIVQLEPLGRTVGGLLGIAIFSALLFVSVGSVGLRRAATLGVLTIVVGLGGLTFRTMVMANFIYDELAVEHLVYAHSTPDVSKVLAEIEELSWRLTGTPDQIQVAYSKEVAWPFYWYMHSRFPENYYFETPDAERLLASPVVIAAQSEWAMVEEILGAAYDAFDYKHIWWPVEDYKGLTGERIRNALTNPQWRQALWDIAWARDYRRYARLLNAEDPFTLKTWPHRVEFRFYVRRDLGPRIWEYGLGEDGTISRAADGMPQAALVDPYPDIVPVGGAAVLAAVPGIGLHGVAAAPDGSLYVVDASNHQVFHLSIEGELLHRWGGHGVAPGQFRDPWDVAVDEAGDVYVADTWNHRIQKFSADGTHLLSWGRFARVEAGDPTSHGAFFGPRGVSVGPDGRVYVADTGNDRIQVFDGEGDFIATFGSSGSGRDGFAEPSDVEVSASGEIYVADAWHQRISVFDADGYATLREWQVPAWGYLSPASRPRLALDTDSVLVTDPAYERVLIFSFEGDLLGSLQDPDLPIQPGGLVGLAGRVVVADERGAQVLIFNR